MSLLKSSSVSDTNGDTVVGGVGDVLTFNFTVTNTGNVTLSNISLSDPLPGIVISGGSILSLAPGQVDATTFTGQYTITQADIDAGFVQNQATVTSNAPGGSTVTDTSDDPFDPTDTDANSDGEPDDPTVTIVPQVIEMEATKTQVVVDNGDGVNGVGDVINYTITLQNTGTVTLQNVALTDALTNMNGVPLVLDSGPSYVSSDLGSNEGILIVNETATYTASYTITQADVDAGGVSNTVVSTGNSPGGNTISDTSDNGNDGDGNTSDDPTELDFQSSPSIDIVKTALPAADGQYDEIGEVINYDIVVTNTGNVTLTNIIITDNNADVNSITPSSIASLAPGESVMVTATHTITIDDSRNAQVVNIANAEGSAPDGSTVSDNSDDPNDPTNVDDNSDGNPDDPTVVQIFSCEINPYNLVTPNNDGDNDYFIIEGLDCYVSNTLEIYNRWGVLVYEKTDYAVNGDYFSGISEGRVTISKEDELPVGTYFYILNYTSSTGESFNKTGYLYLNR